MEAAKKLASVRSPKLTRAKRVRKPQLDENGEEKKCFICGATKNLVRTECCG